MTWIANPNGGEEDANNSTTTPLAAGATFTGVATDISKVSSMTYFMTTDEPSATNGWTLEFSTDGVNWDAKKPLNVETQPATLVNQRHSLLAVSKFFRTVYVNNSTTPQTVFRLQTLLHYTKPPLLISSTQQTLQQWNDASLVRSVSSPEHDANTGKIAYQETVERTGFRSVPNSLPFQDLQAGPDAKLHWLTAASTVRVRAGGNANDTAAGTGARSIRVKGLDTNFNPIEEVIATAGGSASAATTALFLRINSLCVEDCGTYTGTNVGDITLEDTTGSNALATAIAGTGDNQGSQYTIRAGWTGFILRVDHFIEDSNTGDIRLFVREGADIIAAPFKPAVVRHEATDVSGSVPVAKSHWIRVEEKSDIWVEGRRNTGSGDASITVTYELILEKNP